MRQHGRGPPSRASGAAAGAAIPRPPSHPAAGLPADLSLGDPGVVLGSGAPANRDSEGPSAACHSTRAGILAMPLAPKVRR